MSKICRSKRTSRRRGVPARVGPQRERASRVSRRTRYDRGRGPPPSHAYEPPPPRQSRAQKIEWITFRSSVVRTSACAIAALFLPSAISLSMLCRAGQLVERVFLLGTDRRRAPRSPSGRPSILPPRRPGSPPRVPRRPPPAPSGGRRAGGPSFQECERIARLGILAQGDDTDLRMTLAKGARQPGSLRRGTTRRYPDVRDHNVRALGLDCGEQTS